jgi:elongation factor P
MLSFNELGRGSRIIIEKDPYEIIETTHVVKGRGQSVLQAKIKNLKTGRSLSRTFRPSESFLEAEISKTIIKFIYKSKGKYCFSEEKNPKNRFFLEEDKMVFGIKFLKEGDLVDGVFFEDNIIDIIVPIKTNLKVIESPPGIKGNRAQSGNKTIIVEGGSEILAPLFIEEGDIIEINTETGEYVRRVN